MMRARRISKPAYPIAGAKVCDECERPKKIKRNHAGKSYCDACYKRGFTHMPCAGCGKTCVAKRGTVVPYCQACETAHRLCKGCGRHVPRAGMYHEGEVVCPSCVPKFKAKAPCPNCGELSSRLSRVGGEGEAICDRCRNQNDHATCGTCGRYRKQAGEKAGKPICVECVEGTTHICPDCQDDVPGGGTSRCRDCAARARGRVRVDIGLATLTQSWVRELFRGHCETDLLTTPRGSVASRVDTAAEFFSVIDQTMVEPADVTSERLLDTFGPEGLRRASKASSFITDALAVAWPTGQSDAFAERGRIAAMLTGIEGRSWSADIAAYAAELQSPGRQRPLRPHTIRVYLRAAIGMMERCGKGTVTELDADDVQRFVRHSRGHASSLLAFCNWATLHHGIDISVDHRKRQVASAVEKRMLMTTNAVVDRLRRSERRGETMALLAASIGRLYGISLDKVLELRWSDVSQGSTTTLRFGTTEVDIENELAEILFRWNEVRANEIVFASDRRPGAMSRSAIAYHVRRNTPR